MRAALRLSGKAVFVVHAFYGVSGAMVDANKHIRNEAMIRRLFAAAEAQVELASFIIGDFNTEPQRSEELQRVALSGVWQDCCRGKRGAATYHMHSKARKS